MVKRLCFADVSMNEWPSWEPLAQRAKCLLHVNCIHWLRMRLQLALLDPMLNAQGHNGSDEPAPSLMLI